MSRPELWAWGSFVGTLLLLVLVVDLALPLRALFADEDELACILQRLEDQPELVESYRARASNRVREAYTWDHITDGYEALFQAVVEQRTRRSVR